MNKDNYKMYSAQKNKESDVEFQKKTEKLKRVENIQKTSTSNREGQPKKLPQISTIKTRETKSKDKIYIDSLNAIITALNEENKNLKDKNTELEALLSAARDEFEDNENALLEIAEKYDNLELKYNKLKEKLAKTTEHTQVII